MRLGPMPVSVCAAVLVGEHVDRGGAIGKTVEQAIHQLELAVAGGDPDWDSLTVAVRHGAMPGDYMVRTEIMLRAVDTDG